MGRDVSNYFWFNDFKPDVSITVPLDGSAVSLFIKQMIFDEINKKSRVFVRDDDISELLNADVYYISQNKKTMILSRIKKDCEKYNIEIDIDENVKFLEIYIDNAKTKDKYILLEILKIDNTNIKRSMTAQEYHSYKYEYLANKDKYSDYDDYKKSFITRYITSYIIIYMKK